MTDENKDLLESENIILVDEDGEEHTFTMLDVIEVNGCEYAILQPVEEEESDDDEEPEAVILKIDTDEDGEEILVDIEDDDEWERVADAWQEVIDEDEEEEEED